ncbi:MAG: EpsG family protein [Lachnospiraceae bacterium]|nr:EpsG family protein [Lachnospiraceae bacterium]
MAVYLVLAAITISLGFLVDNTVEKPEKTFIDEPMRTRGRVHNKLIISTIFFLLFAISATRIGVGGDYWNYTSIFSLLAQNRDKSVATELGFNLLVKLIQHIFGFDGKQYIIIFAIVAFVTLFFFIKGIEEQSEDFAITFAMFMLLGYYASSFNSIRNYLAFSVAFYSVRYIFSREFSKFLMLVLLASTFHTSVLIVIVAYPLGLIKWKPWMMAVTGAISTSFLAFPNFYRKLVFLIYPHYENSIHDTGEISFTNIARCIGVLVFALIFYKKAIKDNEKNRFYFNMNIFALIVYVCCSYLPVVSRIGYYFNMFQLILVPTLINRIPKKWLRVLLKVLLIVVGVGYYVYFLHSSETNDTRLIPYFNWIIN